MLYLCMTSLNSECFYRSPLMFNWRIFSERVGCGMGVSVSGSCVVHMVHD